MFSPLCSDKVGVFCSSSRLGLYKFFFIYIIYTNIGYYIRSNIIYIYIYIYVCVCVCVCVCYVHVRACLCVKGLVIIGRLYVPIFSCRISLW